MGANNFILNMVKRSKKDPMDFMRDVISGYALKKINKEIISCNKCSLCSKIKTTGFGNSRADILVISDCPLDNNQESMDTVLRRLNIFLDNAYYISVVCCLPVSVIDGTEKYTPPNHNMIDNCSYYVKEVIDIIHPKMIVLMGNIPLNIFVQEPISKMHGKWFEVYCIPAMAVYSPFQILESKDQTDSDTFKTRLDEFYKDWKNIKSALKNIQVK